MRESVGAVVLLQILMVFIVIFISFLAVSINYAQAFRIKNQIVTIIEEEEGCPITNRRCEGSAGARIDELLNNIHYDRDYEVDLRDAGGRGTYYRVATHLNLDLPMLGLVINDFDITGETRIIYQRVDRESR